MIFLRQYLATGNRIPLHTVENYNLQIPEGKSAESVQVFAYVLDCISFLFHQEISTIGQKPLLVYINPNGTNPVCNRQHSLIALHTKPERWAQIAYQYAHELCHFSIPEDVIPQLGWFEESICEMASLYFLRKLTQLWIVTKEHLYTSDGKLYAPCFEEYAKDTEQKYDAFDFHDQTVIQQLEKNRYDRRRNMHLARHLLPIFIDHPKTWEAVPYLCRLQYSTLPEMLDAWLRVSPHEAHPGLKRIQNLFQELPRD